MTTPTKIALGLVGAGVIFAAGWIGGNFVTILLILATVPFALIGLLTGVLWIALIPVMIGGILKVFFWPLFYLWVALLIPTLFGALAIQYTASEGTSMIQRYLDSDGEDTRHEQTQAYLRGEIDVDEIAPYYDTQELRRLQKIRQSRED